MPMQHLVDLAGDIAGVHHFSPVRLRVAVNDPHHFTDALIEGAVRAVRLQLVVLDTIDSSFGKRVDHFRARGGTQSHAWFNDGADDGAIEYSAQTARAGNPKLRSLVFRQESRRELHVQ